jgi:hypothetical protein
LSKKCVARFEWWPDRMHPFVADVREGPSDLEGVVDRLSLGFGMRVRSEGGGAGDTMAGPRPSRDLPGQLGSSAKRTQARPRRRGGRHLGGRHLRANPERYCRKEAISTRRHRPAERSQWRPGADVWPLGPHQENRATLPNGANGKLCGIWRFEGSCPGSGDRELRYEKGRSPPDGEDGRRSAVSTRREPDRAEASAWGGEPVPTEANRSARRRNRQDRCRPQRGWRAQTKPIEEGLGASRRTNPGWGCRRVARPCRDRRVSGGPLGPCGPDRRRLEFRQGQGPTWSP